MPNPPEDTFVRRRVRDPRVLYARSYLLIWTIVRVVGSCSRSCSSSARRLPRRECSAGCTLRYMTAPLSIRFDGRVLARLRQRVRTSPGATMSGLAQRLVEEGLRMAEHPGIVFKDGPSGRRAALAYGPDVWEVVKVLEEIDERGSAAVQAAAEVLTLRESRVRAAMHYYAAYPEEVDAEIAQANEESAAAEAAWLAEQRLLA